MTLGDVVSLMETPLAQTWRLRPSGSVVLSCSSILEIRERDAEQRSAQATLQKQMRTVGLRGIHYDCAELADLRRCVNDVSAVRHRKSSPWPEKPPTVTNRTRHTLRRQQ